jgi:hypothetical protein
MAQALQIMGSILPYFGHSAADPAAAAGAAREGFDAALAAQR